MLTKALMSIILITPFLSSVDESFVEKNSSADLLIQDQCSLDLEPLTNGDITVEQLRNPILTSQTEINQRVDLYSNMYDCLDEGNSTLLEEDRKKFQTLLGYFLIFAGGLGTSADETTLDLVSLASSTDPGVAKIRDEAGIEAPDGYVFVRSYASREAMPGLVRRAFESPEVAGVTILSRYIAVLAEDKKTWPQRALQLQTLPETASHELIHAYVNSTLGQSKLGLPAWFSEGLAIYFSGSEKVHTIVTPNFTISNSSTEDYQRYDTTFKFLEASHGRERLLELINLSIQEADPSILYQDLDISDDQVLVSLAVAWSQQRNNLARGGIIIVALIAALLLWRLAPEYNCPNCGHSGKKKDLIDEVYCPNCKRPYDRAVPW
jgi:transcription elongation factor Elf1